MTDFSALDLAAPIAQALDASGYDKPTPIQQQSIPVVLKGRDILGIAQTGTGKTAAFALPILSHLCRVEKDLPKRGTRVLVLAPTRELARQIADSFRTYGKLVDGLQVQAVFGGVPVNRQIKQIVGGNDVVVATPGRLLDLVNQKALRLDEVEILVLDEADQMMDMGFIHDLRKIAALVPKKRQTLFFSATMPKSIAKLAGQFINDPVKVSVTPAATTAERVSQKLIFVSQSKKQALLTLKLKDKTIDRALIFSRTKHGADRIVKRLARAGIEALAIHGNKSQNQRQRTLEAFASGKVKFLIATDIAARGIDIDGVTHVFNFDLPNVPDQYVHRIGRTARAGRDGQALAFVSPDESSELKDIQKLLKMTIEVEPLPDGFSSEAAKIDALPPVKRPEGEQPKKKPAKRGGKKHRAKAKAAAWSPDKGERKRTAPRETTPSDGQSTTPGARKHNDPRNKPADGAKPKSKRRRSRGRKKPGGNTRPSGQSSGRPNRG